MRTRTVGNDTLGRVEVGAIGLGLMTMNQDGEPAREQLLNTVQGAVESGVTLFDTADAYGHGVDGSKAMGQNERLIAGLLDELGLRSEVLLATKAGHTRGDGGTWDTDSRPEYLRQAVEDSLARLGVEQIQLWQHHRPDPNLDYEATMATLGEIADAGKVAMVGISNASEQEIHIAHRVLGERLVSVQNQFNPGFRSSLAEAKLCEELGLAFLAWSPLGGLNEAKSLAQNHPAFADIATERGVSPQQIALAWELAQSSTLIPIPGAKRPESVRDSAKAAELDLTDAELSRLSAS